MFIGTGVVFFSLFFLAGFIRSISWIEDKITRFRIKTTAPAAAECQLSPEEVAVVSAAVAAALGKKVEIHRIRLLHDESQEAWSRAGRMDIMRSHDLQMPK